VVVCMEEVEEFFLELDFAKCADARWSIQMRF
jgi:hypothetical protein